MQSVLPVAICAAAYGKILLVLRRQARVNPTQRRNVTVATKNTTAGPSKVTAQKTNTEGATSGTTERDKAVDEGNKAKASTSGQNQAGQSSSTGLSKAKINVVRTMILILACFVVCFFLGDIYRFYNTWRVLVYLLTYVLCQIVSTLVQCKYCPEKNQRKDFQKSSISRITRFSSFYTSTVN